MSCGPVPPSLPVVYVSVTSSTLVFAAAFISWFNSLPTVLPARIGVLWNDGGTLAKS